MVLRLSSFLTLEALLLAVVAHCTEFGTGNDDDRDLLANCASPEKAALMQKTRTRAELLDLVNSVSSGLRGNGGLKSAQVALDTRTLGLIDNATARASTMSDTILYGGSAMRNASTLVNTSYVSYDVSASNLTSATDGRLSAVTNTAEFTRSHGSPSAKAGHSLSFWNESDGLHHESVLAASSASHITNSRQPFSNESYESYHASVTSQPSDMKGRSSVIASKAASESPGDSNTTASLSARVDDSNNTYHKSSVASPSEVKERWLTLENESHSIGSSSVDTWRLSTPANETNDESSADSLSTAGGSPPRHAIEVYYGSATDSSADESNYSLSTDSSPETAARSFGFANETNDESSADSLSTAGGSPSRHAIEVYIGSATDSSPAITGRRSTLADESNYSLSTDSSPETAARSFEFANETHHNLLPSVEQEPTIANKFDSEPSPELSSASAGAVGRMTRRSFGLKDDSHYESIPNSPSEVSGRSSGLTRANAYEASNGSDLANQVGRSSAIHNSSNDELTTDPSWAITRRSPGVQNESYMTDSSPVVQWVLSSWKNAIGYDRSSTDTTDSGTANLTHDPLQSPMSHLWSHKPSSVTSNSPLAAADRNPTFDGKSQPLRSMTIIKGRSAMPLQKTLSATSSNLSRAADLRRSKLAGIEQATQRKAEQWIIFLMMTVPFCFFVVCVVICCLQTDPMAAYRCYIGGGDHTSFVSRRSDAIESLPVNYAS